MSLSKNALAKGCAKGLVHVQKEAANVDHFANIKEISVPTKRRRYSFAFADTIKQFSLLTVYVYRAVPKQ